MRLVNVNNLKGSEILGKRIFDDAGRVLLSEGAKLTPFYVDRLKILGVTSVYVNDEFSKGIEIEEPISEKTRMMCKNAVKYMLDKYCKTKTLDNSETIKSVNSIIDDILSNKDVLVNISEIRLSGENLYSHSVNVAVLSVIVGLHMDNSNSRLKDIAVGALLHDLGNKRINK